MITSNTNSDTKPKAKTMIQYNQLTSQEVKSLLRDLSLLIDGDYNSEEEIVQYTGFNLEIARKLLLSVNKLKQVDFYSKE
jgi:hypothetical protein